MEKDAIKIDELEYFNPFVSIKDQCNNLIYCGDISCDLAEQQKHFLQMACFDGTKEENRKCINLKRFQEETDEEKKENLRLQINKRKTIELKEWLYSRYFAPKINLCSTSYTEERAIKLNKMIKSHKTAINTYIKSVEDRNINKIDKIKNNTKCEKNVPYVFYLQDIIKTLKINNDTNNRPFEYIENWNNTFKLENDTELLNFQGCLGLLLMNEFCLYHKSNQFQLCVFCSMLITSLYFNSPIYDLIELKYIKALDTSVKNEQKYDSDRHKGSQNRDKKYKSFRKHFKEKQKEEFLKNPKLTANSFAHKFHENPSMEIPYQKQNALNQLKKLAEKNNREFKKTFASKSGD